MTNGAAANDAAADDSATDDAPIVEMELTRVDEELDQQRLCIVLTELCSKRLKMWRALRIHIIQLQQPEFPSVITK